MSDKSESVSTENLLKSNSPDLIYKGIDKARLNGSIKSLGLLLQLRESNNPEIKKKATDTACNILLKHLVSSFSKINSDTRNDFVFILKQMNPGICNVLKKKITSVKTKNRTGMLQLLSIIDTTDDTVKFITKLAWDNDIQVRATAVKILGRLIDPKDITKILRFLYDNDNRVIANTIESLEEIGNRNILGILMRFRNHGNNRIRANSLKALWNLGYKGIIRDVSDMLGDPNELMRASAVWLIGQIGGTGPELTKLLEGMVNDESPLVKSNLIRSINIIGTDPVKKIISKINIKEVKQIHSLARHRLHDISMNKDARVRATSVKILGTMIDNRDIHQLTNMLNDPDQRVVANTIETLEAIGGQRILEYLHKYRKHRNNRVRANALKALWHYGVTDIADDLKAMLNDRNEFMRASAVWVIGEISGADYTISSLLKLVINDQSRIVQRNIKKAKTKITSAISMIKKNP